MIAGMSSDIAPGLTGEARRVVTQDQTSIALRSGDVPVFGTPALLAMMEEAAVAALHGHLADGATSVGTSADLEHLSPSRVGAEVRAIARVAEVDGRTLAFEIEAYDGETLIGRARHRRVIVERARFGG